jgi:PAS domain S-box-containing protein
MKNNEFLSKFKAARIRLIVGIPVTMFLFTLSSGVLALSLTKSTFLGGHQARLSTALLVILAMAVTALFGGILLAHGITKPLKEMKRKGEEILSSPVLPPQHNEISELAQVFNQMSFSLSQFIKDHQILENLPEGLIVIDPSGTIITANKMVEEIFGADLKGRPYWEAIPHDPQNMAFLESVDRALRGESFALPQEIKIRNINKQVSTLWVSISPFKDKKGIAISIKDLRELRRIRDQIRRAESLAGLGTLASILSHEIKNPLGSIRGLLELLYGTFSPEDRRRTYVHRTIQEIDRLIRISEDLLGLLRMDVLDMKDAVDLNDLLREALSLNQYEFKAKKIAVQEKYDEDLPCIKADPEKLTLALVNFIINAFQATPEGGQVSVATERIPYGISIHIHNSGSYIPPEDRESIFLPSYSTKAHGSGFGLFLAQRIILAHNGTIEVQSDPEEGTTFRIDLPLDYEGGSGV